MTNRSLPKYILPTLLVLSLFILLPASVKAVNINSLGIPVTENFNTLAMSGTSSTVPADWAFSETGTNANATYTAGTGSGNAGDTYSFGSATSNERAFGGLQSGTLIPTIGGAFTNNTGATITSLDIAYTGEQWRLGFVGRIDRIDFQYSTNATSLTTGTWTDVDTLDFVAPTTGPTVGALDGNSAANQTAVSATISSLSIANGITFWIRWTDFNATNADDGLAIDDFSITANSTGDAPPAISSTVPTNGDSNVSVSSNLSITFNESVNVSAGWYNITCGSSGNHTAVVSGGPTAWTLNPDTDFASGESCTVTIDSTLVSDTDTDDPPDNMTADHVFTFTTFTCGSGTTLISAIQGSSLTSPMTGSVRTIAGIVVGDFQNTTTQLSGFYVQEEDAQADGNSATSEGIFVFDNGFGTDVTIGDWVQVQGTVTEYVTTGASLTELNAITNVTVCNSGNPSPTAATITLPLSALTDWERYEGMLVNFPQPLTTTEVYDLGRYGEVALSQGGRLFQFTHNNAPSVTGYAAFLTSIQLRSLVLDDANTQQNRDPITHPAPGLTAANTLRVGDTVSNLTGILDHRFNFYRVQPTETVTFTGSNGRSTIPDDIGGTIKVASFNVLNYFTTLGSRGANTPSELTRQANKIVPAILSLNADIVGLIEIENDGSSTAIQDLVNRLNLVAGPGTYTYVNTGVLGSDEIKVAFIYKPARVNTVGSWATTSAGAFSARNRQPLAQTFSAITSGETFTVIINHFKSKGSDCDTAAPPFPADPDINDGQGNCNVTRTMAANDLVAWLGTNPTGTADPDYLIMGDLNSYTLEDPITTITGAGYTNLINAFLGGSAYSFVFIGQSGYLDHALATAGLSSEVTGVTQWHINADEPRALDYNEEFKSAGQLISLYNADAYRAADHDPVLVGLFPIDFSDLAGSYGIAWHKGNGVLRLGSGWTSDAIFGPDSDNGTDDGVTRTGNWTPGGNGAVNVTVTGCSSAPCFVNAWVDWNDNGVFDGGEQILSNEAVNNGPQTLNFNVLASPTCFGAPLTCEARFRLTATTDDGFAPVTATGAAISGEVEDYVWGFSPTAVSLQTLTVQSGIGLWWAVGITLLVIMGMVVWQYGRRSKTI